LESKIREQEHTIGKLTTEKGTMEIQLGDIRQIPAEVPILFSNVVRLIDLQPTNSQQWFSVLSGLQTITNQLADILARPMFELIVNGQLAKNGSPFSVKNSRQLLFKLRNLSEFTAEQITVVMWLPFPIDKTNVIASPAWGHLPIPAMYRINNIDNGIPIYNQWQWRAENIQAGFQVYNVDAFEVSTNCPSGSYVITINVYSARSKREEYIGQWTL
jgi:hypothetical protein